MGDAVSIQSPWRRDNGSILLRRTGTVTLPGSVTIDSVAYTFPAADASGVLTSDGLGSLSWAAAASANTLDQAYDQGGAGAGRTITADSGAVQIDGTGGLIVSAAPVKILHTDAVTSANDAISIKKATSVSARIESTGTTSSAFWGSTNDSLKTTSVEIFGSAAAGGLAERGFLNYTGTASLAINTTGAVPILFSTSGFANEKMRIAAAGEVGIGATPASNTMLHAERNMNGTPVLILQNTTNGASARVLIQATSNGGAISLGRTATGFNPVGGQLADDSFISGTGAMLSLLTVSSPIRFAPSLVERFRILDGGGLVNGNGEGGVVAATGSILRGPDITTGGAGNIAGTDLTGGPGLGTGTGDPGRLILQAVLQAAAGDNLQAREDRLILDEERIETNEAHLLSTQATAPTGDLTGTTLNDGGGTGAAFAITAGSTDIAGSFTITAGNGTPGTGKAGKVLFDIAYNAAPKSITLTAKDADGVDNQVYVPVVDTAGFEVHFNTALSASEVVEFYYKVIE